MRKFLLSMALVLCTIGAMAQSTMEFTFARNGGNPTVTATLDGEATDITATISTSPEGLLAAANRGEDTNQSEDVLESILIINRNTNSATAEDPNSYTLTINGLGKYIFTGITVEGYGVNNKGEFQGLDTRRSRNFIIGYGASAESLTNTEPALKSINDNSHCNGTPTSHTFDVEGTSEGNLIIKVQIYTDGGSGCFYGLSKIKIEGLEVIEPEVSTGYTLKPVTASDLMSKTTATRIAIRNVAYNNLNWLDIKKSANSDNSPAEYSEEVVFIWEPVTDGAAGSYRIKDNNGEYLQNDGANNVITLGTIDNAAVFTAVVPEFNYDNASKEFSQNEQDKLVRFKTGNVWINTQQPHQLAKYNTGTGTFTIHFAYELTEVEKFVADFTKAEYASFYAPNSVTIPENVEAYYLTNEGFNDSYVSLTKIDNGIIPAFTAVILRSSINEEVSLNVTDEEVENINGNLLKGTLVRRHVELDNAYVLAKPNDAEVGLYKAQITVVENNPYEKRVFINNAGKAYLPASAVPAAAQASNGFRFGEGTTGVEKVEIRNEKSEIYDLTGRRVETIIAPGIYIVGGKKVLVK